jgi:hypothetical protein
MRFNSRPLSFAVVFFTIVSIASPLMAAYGDNDGPYPLTTGIHGGNRLDPAAYPQPDPYLTGWATQVVDFQRDVSTVTFGAPADTLGQPGGTEDTFSLGDGGWITLGFSQSITNIPGFDFAVWENGFFQAGGGSGELLFAELMFVEVSTDGVHFARFPSDCRIPGPVGGFGAIDPTYVNNLAGKHPNGNGGKDEGTPFDLEDLRDHPLVVSGDVDLDNINYVKLVDVIGDGSTADASGRPIYDPHPTPFASGGADLDAVGILQASLPPDMPALLSPSDGASGLSLVPTLRAGAFSDPDQADFHLKSQWQIAETDSFSNPVFNAVSTYNLVAMRVPDFVLAASTDYYWRVQYVDSRGNPSDWSPVWSFTTGVSSMIDNNLNGIPDDQENGAVTDLDQDGELDAVQVGFKVVSAAQGSGQVGVKVPPGVTIESIQAVRVDDLPPLPGEPQLPLGLVSFRLAVPVGATIEATAFLSTAPRQTLRWYKYHPASGWTDFSDNSLIERLPDGRVQVRLTLTDGGDGDSDGVANGIIVDPGGVGVVSSSSSGSNSSTQKGVSGSCFIGSIQRHWATTLCDAIRRLFH